MAEKQESERDALGLDEQGNESGVRTHAAPSVTNVRLDEAFELGIEQLLDRVMPLPLMIVCATIAWHGASPLHTGLVAGAYIAMNFGLSWWTLRRFAQGHEERYLSGNIRIVLNSVGCGLIAYVGGPNAHGWVMALILMCVMGCLPGMSAWIGNALLTVCALGGYLAGGASAYNVFPAITLLVSISLISTPLVKLFRELWEGLVGAGHALESANEELRERHDQLKALLAETQQAVHAKDRFLANMSHEMRTPLNGIVGMISLLRESGLRPDQQDLLEIAQNSANDLLAQVRDILDLARMEAGRLELQSEPFDLVHELERLGSEFQQQPAHEQKRFRFEVGGPVASWFSGDRTRIRQVVRNLLANAFKFTEPRGSIVLRLEASPGRTTGSANVRISVIDDGIGIPADAQQRIFERFEQVDPSTTRKYGGTGLGLAICRQLTEAMGGKIGVRSEIGQGSTFWIELEMPCSGGERIGPASAVAAPTPARGSARRILLVEDVRINQLVARRLLEKMGCEVDVAENGVLALDLLKRKQFDAVLMDLMLPELDGYETTRALRQLERMRGARRTPVIAVTAAVTAKDRERCRSVGMDGFVEKPIQRGELEQALRDAFAPLAS